MKYTKKIKRQLSRPGKETQHMASYEERWKEGRREVFKKGMLPDNSYLVEMYTIVYIP